MAHQKMTTRPFIAVLSDQPWSMVPMQVWNGNLTQAHAAYNDIERVQKRALRIIVPEYEYNRALQECELKTLQERRDDLCVRLIKQMSEPCIA